MELGRTEVVAAPDVFISLVTAAIDSALAQGVPRVHIISHKAPDSLLLEIFTNEGTGTLVVNDIAALTEAEQASGS